jgi:hypothetical protein
MKYYLFIISIVLLFSCKKEVELERVTYKDYLKDKELIAYIHKKNPDCSELETLYKQVNSIDFKHELKRQFKHCEIDFKDKFSLVENKDLLDKLNSIYYQDQKVRDEWQKLQLKTILENKEHYIKYIAPIDSANAVKLNQIISDLGEWPGVEYIERKPSEPKLDVLIGHFPENEYVMFTKMAYKAATENKEYWSRVFGMITFSGTRPIEDKFLYDSLYIIPFRFVEITSTGLIDENSDISILEFDTLSNSQMLYEGPDGYILPKYKISSSLEEKEQRIQIVSQAKNLLINLGLEENRILLDYDKQDDYRGYKLFYELIR